MKSKIIMNKRILYIFIAILLVQITTPFNQIEANEDNNNYLTTIEEIIDWKKTSLSIPEDEVILNKTFLKNAGDTTGDWFPIGLGRIGYPDDYDAYLAVVANEVTERYKEEHLLSESKATEWHRISLAILAMEGDPTNIGTDTDGESINLIEDGTYNREKHNSIGNQGINGWIWALIALDSMRYSVPEDALTDRQAIITQILQRQLKDGGFSLSEEAADPDMTGMAITALSPYYNSEETFTFERQSSDEKVTRTVREVVDEAVETLSSIQLDSGGFSTMEMENTESIVQVIVGLTSLGIDIFTDERFIKNKNTMYDALMEFQMTDGGYTHSNEFDEDNPTAKPGESNAMATDQALYALVSLYRAENNHRNLYDFRPELSEDVKEKISLVEQEIDSLENDADEVNEVYTLYKSIPLEERSYVKNYTVLANKMKELKIDLESESISENIGINQNGNGTVTPLFSGDVKEDEEITPEDLNQLEKIIGAQSTEYEVDVIRLLNKLESSEESFETEIKVLEEEKEMIDTLQLEIDDLNETIVAELFPFENIDAKDEQKVEKIMKRYDKLSIFDQEKIVNYEDVEKAKAQIETMKRNKIITIILSVVVITAIGLFFYRRKRKKQAKQESSYMNN